MKNRSNKLEFGTLRKATHAHRNVPNLTLRELRQKMYGWGNSGRCNFDSYYYEKGKVQIMGELFETKISKINWLSLSYKLHTKSLRNFKTVTLPWKLYARIQNTELCLLECLEFMKYIVMTAMKSVADKIDEIFEQKSHHVLNVGNSVMGVS